MAFNKNGQNHLYSFRKHKPNYSINNGDIDKKFGADFVNSITITKNKKVFRIG